MMIKAVAFDAVGTLLLLREPVGQTYASFAQRHGMGMGIDPKQLSAGFRDALRSTPAPTPEEFLCDDGKDFWRRIVRKTFATAGAGAPDEELFEVLYAHYGTIQPWGLADHVEQVLTELSTTLRLAVLSNFDRRLHALINGFGLSNFFELVVVSSEIGYEKPHPKAFEALANGLQLNPAEILYVGDDPQRDWGGAEAAGMAVYELSDSMRLEKVPRFCRALVK